MFSLLVLLWMLSGLFGGLFGIGDGNCAMAEEQGARKMREIGEQWPLRSVDDPVSEYVQRVGLRMARVVDPRARELWDFYVLRNAEPSAIAVGGGHFVISDGLVAFARNESELAAVLAHEISHQSLGHFCRRISPATEQFDHGTVVQHYDLEVEMDADREALRLLAAAGFDPGAMASVLRSLSRLPGSRGSQLRKRIQALGRRQIASGQWDRAQSAAFAEAQRSVMDDLADFARPARH